MTRIVRSFALVAVVLSSLALAQEGPPPPAPELKHLEPLVGNWTGSGTMKSPDAKEVAWKANGTFRWALDGHFLQEDFAILFEQSTPLVFRCYYGWDRENKRFVNAVATSAGEVALHEVGLQPDGSLLMLMVQNQNGERFVERSLLKVDGDKMQHSIDLLPGAGPSMTMLDCTFKRSDTPSDVQFQGPSFRNVQPHEALAKLCRSAGEYDVKGEMRMSADAPGMKVSGTDTVRAVFGGVVVHAHTEGSAEGIPGKYVGEVFWGHDAAKNRLVALYVGSSGEVAQMEAWWAGDKLISTSSGLWMGQPSAQRMVMEFDGSGAVTRASSHSIVGDGAPFESFRGTYAKKK